MSTRDLERATTSRAVVSSSGPGTQDGTDLGKRWGCSLVGMIKFFDLDTKRGVRSFIAAYMIVILMHPLHYYAYVISEQQQCLEVDNQLYGTFSVVAFCNICMMLHVPKVIGNLRAKKITPRQLAKHFIFTQIPLLLMTMTILPDLTTGTTNKIFLTTTNLFLFGYMLLVIGLSLTIKEASHAVFDDAKWAKAAFNFFLFLHGGHVFGALWYCLAIDRIIACWRENYPSANGGNPPIFLCGSEYSHQLSCPKIAEARKDKSVVFGIFNDAFHSGIVNIKAFPKKFLYCLRWGLQALSCFGQNLQPSTFPLENIYVISVTIYSTVLFVFLIGNMQSYLQPDTQEKTNLKEQVADWKSFRKLPEDLKKEVKNFMPNSWVDPSLFSILPEDVIKKIKIELCLPQLNKVEEFQSWSDSKLKDLCDCVKPAFYVKHTLIIREDYPITDMVFVLQGTVCTYTSRDPCCSKRKKDRRKDAGVFGEELVKYVQTDPNPSSFPISKITIEALKDVEAFVLRAYDLRMFIKKNQEQAEPGIIWE